MIITNRTGVSDRLQAALKAPPIDRRAIERVNEPTSRRTCHHTSPGSAEPIIGIRQTQGRSLVGLPQLAGHRFPAPSLVGHMRRDTTTLAAVAAGLPS